MKMKTKVLGLAGLGLVAGILGNYSLACSCMMPGTPLEAKEKADNVYVGFVKIVDTVDKKNEVIFAVKKTIKGKKRDFRTVYTAKDGATCGFEFEKGKDYLVYSKYNKDTQQETVSLCSRTKLLDTAEEDMQAFGFDYTIRKMSSYPTKEALLQAEPHCKTATDGVNTYFGKDLEASTYIGEPENFVPKWKCINTRDKVKGSNKDEVILLGGDKDEHGCRTSAGYVWSEKKQQCVRPWEEKTYKTLDELKKAEPNCKTATDGVNTYFGKDLMASTMIGEPENFVPEWKCIDNEHNTTIGGEEKICTTEYMPVCGVDGNTYGNKCGAGEVKIAYEGECLTPLSENDKNLMQHIKIKLPKSYQTLAKKFVQLVDKKYQNTVNKKQKYAELIHKIDDIIGVLLAEHPQDTALPRKTNNLYLMLQLIKLELKKEIDA